MTVIDRVPAIWCIGRNYADHAAELGNQRPERPLVFMKNPASVIGDGEAIVIPEICHFPQSQVDWEAELGVVIGRDACNLSVEEAMACVSHFRIANDVTARWWQKEGSGGQFVRGKSFDTFCPVGPAVPASTIADPQALAIETRLNGEVVQSSNTSAMIFTIAELLVELTRGTTLLAGTLLLTGTPAGVGAGMTPPKFLESGDVVEIEIEGLGRLRNTVEAAPRK
jgi:2-keto-4-pentenoate hydratase/2-oxohepta-3-ene-1,7-dioic acid hydratase in catechol pathway